MKTDSKSSPKMFETNYYVAVHWLHNNIILCNNVTEIDPSVYDNLRFELEDEDGNYREIFQWYLTDCGKSDVEFLEEHFGLLFTYSEELGLYVLAVEHWGTFWDYVYRETDLKDAQAKLGEFTPNKHRD